MSQDFSKAINTNFRPVIRDLPNLEFFMTDAPIPDLNSTPATATLRHLDVPLVGDKIDFSPITVGFLIDENWHTYQELYHWLFSQQNPLKPELSDNLMTEIYIDILNNNKNVIARLDFIDAFPTNLGGVVYNVQGGGEVLTANITFSYSYFKFKRLDGSTPPVNTLSTTLKSLPKI